MYKLSIFYKKGVKLYRPTEEEIKRRQEEFRKIKLEELTKVAEEILKVPHKKRADGKYDIYGDVYLDNMYLTSLLELPIRFGKVYGIFSCYNNQLKDLRGAPEYVSKSFWCGHNELTSLEGAPIYVNGTFLCSDNHLRDLKGAPAYVGGHFDCSYNKLISLEGVPKSISGVFRCNNNQLRDLKEAPEYVGGDFHIQNNRKKFTEEEIRKVVNVKGDVYVGDIYV